MANLGRRTDTSLHGRVNRGLTFRVGGLAGEEQTGFNRFSEFISQPIRMGRGRAVSTTNIWVFRPVVVNVIHKVIGRWGRLG